MKLATRLTRGEKRNRKRMAEVAAIYSVAPFPRSVTDVMHDLRPAGEVKPKRPRPKNKRVSASVDSSAAQVIQQTFDEALRRDPKAATPLGGARRRQPRSDRHHPQSGQGTLSSHPYFLRSHAAP